MKHILVHLLRQGSTRVLGPGRLVSPGNMAAKQEQEGGGRTAKTSNTCFAARGLLKAMLINLAAAALLVSADISSAQEAPTITAQPQSQTVVAGSDSTFSVTAQGTDPLSYQWRKDGASMADATAASLVVPNVQLADVGNYSVVVSNDYGAVTSTVAVLKIIGLPVVSVDGQAVLSGSVTRPVSAQVTMETDFTDGFIFYTLDDSEPSFGSELYGGPFVLTSSAVVRAIAYSGDFSESVMGNPIEVRVLPVYTLTLTTSGGGTVSADPASGPYISNSIVNITATPNSGWNFLYWTGDATATNSSLSLTMNGPRSIQAVFGTRVNTNIVGQGTILRNPDLALYPYGSTMRLSAVPNSGSSFTRWTGASTSTNSPLWVTVNNANPTYTALFTTLAANRFALTLLVNGSGRLAAVPARNVFTNGESVTVTASPDPSQAFDFWSGDASGTQNPLTLLMSQSRIVTANFTVATPPVITGQPQGQAFPIGATFALSVTVSGSPPLSYQWYKDNGALNAMTNSSLPISNAQTGQAGSYFVTVSNVAGGATSQVAVLSAILPPTITGQPQSQIAGAGSNVLFSVTAAGTEPLYYQWRKQGINIPGAQSASLVLTNVNLLDTGSYDVIITNAFGSVTSTVASLTFLSTPDSFNPGADNNVYSLAVEADGGILVGGYFTALGGQTRNRVGRLNADGTLDSAFNPSANDLVVSLAVQADGKILVGGGFTTLGGQTRNRIGRLNADGTVDTAFNPNAGNTVDSVAVQADGKILVGGAFTTLGGQTRNCLGRLNADGTLDSAFNPSANDLVVSLAVQADGKILVGGYFTALGGQTRNRVGRLNADGTLDSAFNPSANDLVVSLAVQADGKILVGGGFTTLGGQTRNRIGRLNADGTVDTAFNPNAGNTVDSVAVQADGKILVGGAFTTLGGQTRNCLGRLNADGTLDSAFNPSANGSVFSLVVQADGKILVGGDFTTLGGQTRNRIGRLNADGTVDTAFNPNAGNTVDSVAVQADGKILVGGAFTTLGGQTRNRIARLSNDGPATQNLSYGGSTITWLRGGTSPEVWRTTFEVFTNGSDWVNLGSGTRISGGWQLAGVPVTANVTIRARGYLTGGYHNSSGWFVETVLGPLLIASQPSSRTNDAGTAAKFEVSAYGSPPISYQWLKDGVNLSDGGKLSGTLTSTLTLSNVLGGDAGGYSVIISNALGSTTSLVATLTVADPAIAVQPVGQAVNLGQTAAFTVAATGSDPFYYQWRKDGVSIPGAQSNSLNVTNIQELDIGTYDVVVSNVFGSVTSTVAWLSFPVTADSFNPGAGSTLYCLALQADDKILVGGAFTTLGGQTRNRIGRLNADGTLDTAFNPNAGSTVYSLAVQVDGKILVGGNFTTLGGQTRNNLGRLNSDGTLDTAFNPNAGGMVYSLAMQADGKILVGGQFTTLGGQTCNYLGRLNADGTLDTAFDPNAGGTVYSLAVQADGKILVGGSFTTLGGQSRTNIGRLNADGTLETSFYPQADNQVRTLAIQADGQILVGGSFTTLGGQNRANIGRLNNTYPATQKLALDGSTITWLRGGPSPGVWRTTFDYFTSLSGWVSLGTGTRIPGGWQLAAVSTPANATIRGRGFVQNDSSGWFVETFTGPPAFSSQPISRTNNALTTATFAVAALGTGPYNYQWCKDGNGLNDAGNVSGAITSTLTLSNVLGGDAGSYSVIVNNLSGSSTSLVATLKVVDPFITSQPTNQTANFGQTALLTVGAVGTAPFNYQWRKNGAPVAGATALTLTLTNLQAADAGNYDVLVSNGFTSATSAVAVLTVNMALPDTFNPGANNAVYSCAVQADGRVLVGGSFTTLGGQSRTNIGRLNDDGTLDGSFNPGAGSTGAGSTVNSITVQADGRILVGGRFTTLAGQSRTNIGRLNDDGTLDGSFNPNAGSTNAGSMVNSITVQVDGRILVGGDFTTLGGQTRNRIGRLNADGSLDTAFNPGAGYPVYSLALQADGKILVGGDFTTLGGQTRNRIGRLNADGSLDTAFNPNAGYTVYSVAVQADGKILVGGDFTTLGGQTRNYLGRLNADGTLDTAFSSNAGSVVNSLAVQADGKILVGGQFTTLGGQTRNRIGRLNANSSLDTAFDPNAGSTVLSTVLSLAVQPDGKILVGGYFTTLGGQTRSNLGRLNSVDPAIQSLVLQGTTITWLRDGTSPEVWRTSFDASTNGSDWVSLGAGTRIPGGWQLDSISAPPRCTIRARGFLTGGNNNGSGWFAETILDTRLTGPPVIYTHPASQTNTAWATATLNVSAEGAPPLGYRWCKGGDVLNDAGSISGTQTPSLTLSNLLGGDSGGYSVVISNTLGSVTSLVATLTVVDPVILTQPSNQTVNAGTDVGFSVAVAGTAPLGYQWRKDGAPMAGATATSLALTNVQWVAGGNYDLVVSNSYGSMTSRVAVLTVRTPPAITAEPQSQTVWAGSNVTFTVTAQGTAPMSYQWYKGGVVLGNGGGISGVQTPTLALSSVLGGDAGGYSVVITNAFGSVTSQVASLTVIVPPAITAQPQNQSARAGSNVTFTVTAQGTLPLSYRWFKDTNTVNDGGSISGAQTSTLTLSNALGGNAGGYSVVISNAAGSVTSWTAVLNVTDPVITSQPVSQSANAGTNVTFSMTAVGTAPLGYQWRKDSAPMAGATATSLAFTNVQSVAGGSYDVVVTNSYGGATSAVAVLTVIVRPTITGQPRTQSVWLGSNVTLTVTAQGTVPLSYQWWVGGAALALATNSSLHLANIQPDQAGSYTVTISNLGGSVTSAPAILTVVSDTARLVRLIGTNGSAGGVVTVPIQLAAQGNENAIGFSVGFDPSLLTFELASIGSGVNGANFNLNTNQAASGKIGMTVAFPTGNTFALGTQEVVRLSFLVATGVDVSIPINFTDQPIAREVSDPEATPLVAAFIGGTISTGSGYEADVTPLPNGNGVVSVTDWVKVGRYVAGLDTVPSNSQFQRADCAPRATLGDGKLTVSDWVQAGRYAAGLDPLTPVGGPMTASGAAPLLNKAKLAAKAEVPGPKDALDDTNRVVRVADRTIYPGQTNSVSIWLQGLGDETALGFSLAFDTSVLGFSGATLGAGAPGGTLNVNTNQLGVGLLGLALTLPTGSTFAPGTQEVAKVDFAVAMTASGSMPVAFADQPVLREISDVFANALTAGYTNGVLTVFVEPPKVLRLYPQTMQSQGYFRITATNIDGSLIESQRLSKIDLFSTTNPRLNLTNWSKLTNAPVLTNGQLLWNDNALTNAPLRFYRTIEKP